jgi:hypothetical protein
MRWKSSADQIAIVIDCASGRISLESAAGLLRLRPAETILREIEAVRARRASKSVSEAVGEHP